MIRGITTSQGAAMTLTPENKADACADAVLLICKLLHEKGLVSAQDVVHEFRGMASFREKDEGARASALNGLAAYLERALLASAS